MDEISGFLSQYQELKLRGGIVQCTLSGHEMPCRLEALQSYVAGKKFVRLRAEAGFNYKSLEPLIVSSAKRRNPLYCTLTNCYLNRKPAAVEGHLMGRKYKKALEKYNAGELKLCQEKVKDASDTREHTECTDDDVGDIGVPRDQSDFETECNPHSSNSRGDAEKTRHSSNLDEPTKSSKRKQDSTFPTAKRLKLAKKAKQRRLKT